MLFCPVSALCPSGAENTPGLIRGETLLLFALVGLLAVNQGSHEGLGLITFPKALRSPQERDRSLAWKLSHRQAPMAPSDSLSPAWATFIPQQR